MYRLKEVPEDFIVVEIPTLAEGGNGPHLYFTLQKRNWNTLDVVKEIAKKLHVNSKNIGFAGSKDKHAVTQQLISIKGRKKEQVLGVKLESVEIEYYGAGKEPITLGELEGNYFEIVIRNLEKEGVSEVTCCENYFDEQRFSSDNAEIGRLLVKKRFKEAVALIGRDKVQEYMKKKKNDAIGALRLLPNRLLRMYVNAYQSYLWNECVSKYLERFEVMKKVDYSLGELVFVNCEDKSLEIPLIGFSSEELESGEIKEIIATVMKAEQLMYRDFVIKQIPQLSLEGEMRKVFTEVKKLEVGKFEDDELFEGKKKVTVSFTLGKGSYATMIVKRLLG